MTLDMAFVERCFLALSPRDFVYFDNAGGSLVLDGVAYAPHRLIDVQAFDADLRVPTISFIVEDQDSRAIVEHIDRFDIGIRYGDFYARRLIEALGLEKQNGVVRVSMLHYNTEEEVDRLIGHFETVLPRRVS